MSPTTSTTTANVAFAAVELLHDTCAVCDHSVRDHDAVALRYCTATVSNAISRNCICTPHPA